MPDELPTLIAVLAGTGVMLAVLLAMRKRGVAYRASPRSRENARRALDHYGSHDAMLAASRQRPDGIHELRLPKERGDATRDAGRTQDPP